MMTRRQTSMLAAALILAPLACDDRPRPKTGKLTPTTAATAAPATSPESDLQAQIKALQELVPDQAAIMTHVAYHFTNLWFAAQKENWPLADFYLGETRNNLKWAVRAKPIRTDKQGMTVNLEAIREAFDNTELTRMKKAIEQKDKDRFTALYRESLTVCYSCHKASDKPYLRPQVPTAPEVRIINFDPAATWPQ